MSRAPHIRHRRAALARRARAVLARSARAVLAVPTALLVSLAATPWARAVAMPPGSGSGMMPRARVPAHTGLHGGGMPGWQIILIALAAALLATAAASSPSGRGRRAAARHPQSPEP
jgi:hypothetical protein